jgi:hypothetical protein
VNAKAVPASISNLRKRMGVSWGWRPNIGRNVTR